MGLWAHGAATDPWYHGSGMNSSQAARKQGRKAGKESNPLSLRLTQRNNGIVLERASQSYLWTTRERCRPIKF